MPMIELDPPFMDQRFVSLAAESVSRLSFLKPGSMSPFADQFQSYVRSRIVDYSWDHTRRNFFGQPVWTPHH